MGRRVTRTQRGQSHLAYDRLSPLFSFLKGLFGIINMQPRRDVWRCVGLLAINSGVCRDGHQTPRDELRQQTRRGMCVMVFQTLELPVPRSHRTLLEESAPILG